METIELIRIEYEKFQKNLEELQLMKDVGETLKVYKRMIMTRKYD